MTWAGVAIFVGKVVVWSLAWLAASVVFVCLIWKHLVHPRDEDGGN